MKACSLIVALYVSTVFAQANNGLPVSGPNSPGLDETPASQQVAERAGRHPNETNSVTFSRTFDNKEETWTWRINLTEIAIPSRISDLRTPSADFSEGLHVANVQWQLQWPGNDNQTLTSFLEERNLTLSIDTLITTKPSNITSKYSDSDNGDCTAMLGKQCVQSLTQGDGFVGLDGCEDTLDAGHDGLSTGVGFPAPATHRDDTFYYLTTDSDSGSNLTNYRQVESTLQLLVLDFQSHADEHGAISGPTVLCRMLKSPDESSAVGWPSTGIALRCLVVLTALFMWI